MTPAPDEYAHAPATFSVLRCHCSARTASPESGFGAAKAEIDLRPGGALVMEWAEHGTGYAQIDQVDEPAFFSFRWGLEPGARPAPGEETLVEFTLTPEAEGTRLRVVESGFSKLDRPAEKQEWHRERNVDGWRQVLEAVAAGA